MEKELTELKCRDCIHCIMCGMGANFRIEYLCTQSGYMVNKDDGACISVLPKKKPGKRRECVTK